jgi:hypothetical protein
MEHIKEPFELYMINQWISESVIAHLVNKMMHEYCIISNIMTPLDLSASSFWMWVLGKKK